MPVTSHDAASQPRPAGWRRAGVSLEARDLLSAPRDGRSTSPRPRAIIDRLADAGVRALQLPITVAPGPDGAPASAFAGDRRALDFDELRALGLMEADDHSVDTAIDRLLHLPESDPLARELFRFCERESWWLADHVAFVETARQHPGTTRAEWPRTDRIRALGAHRARSSTYGATHRHPEAAVQFLVDRQRQQLLDHARRRDVLLIADVPYAVSDHSADVWSMPDAFSLDEDLHARHRVGRAPDPSHPGGIAWSMPALRWNTHTADGFTWWLRRIQHATRGADVLHLQDARLFADWWCIPPQAAFATTGEWHDGPGHVLIEQARTQVPDATVVFDESGPRTPRLDAVAVALDGPRSRSLTRGFMAGGASADLPFAWSDQDVASTSMHGEPSVAEWARQHAGSAAVAFAMRVTGATNPDELPMAAIDTLLRSTARVATVPLGAVLGERASTSHLAHELLHDDAVLERVRDTLSGTDRGTP